MKKLIAPVLVALLFLAFHSYTEQRFEKDSAAGVLEHRKTWAGKLGKTQRL